VKNRQDDMHERSGEPVKGDPLGDRDDIDSVLREHGAVEPPEGSFESLRERIWPQSQLYPNGVVGAPRWLLRLAWVSTVLAVILVAVSVSLTLRARSLEHRNADLAHELDSDIHMPEQYDPTVDLIVHRSGKVLAYEPPEIDGDLRLFIETLERHPSSLQWIAVSGDQVQVGLGSPESEAEWRKTTDRAKGDRSDLFYFQVSVLRARGGSPRPFVARLFALPGSSVRLNAKSVDGADVTLSLLARAPGGLRCPDVLELRYGVSQADRHSLGISARLDPEMSGPVCAGTFSSGQAVYTVFVSIRRLSLEFGRIRSSA